MSLSSCRTGLARSNSHARTGTGKYSFFPVQLSTSRFGNLTRLILTCYMYVMTIHTYIRGVLYAVDACIVSRSPRGLERMMAVFVGVFGTFGLTISESKTETMCMPILRAPATNIVFNTTGQQYRQTTSFNYLGGTMTETPNLSDETDRWIRTGWMGFKRYKRELYDRPKASLLPLKARMVRSEVVETLSYGCATWSPLKGHYAKLRTTHHRMLLRILGA